MSEVMYTAAEVISDRYRYCMVARYHSGDENGNSKAKFAKFKLSEEAKTAGYVDVWLEYEKSVTVKESSSDVRCSDKPACVFMERKHSGDENANTSYQISRVVASKIREDGSTMLHPCITKNISEVTSSNESKAGWVEQGGKVIIGRSHSGDENGRTVTTFGEIYILDDQTGSTYPLKLEDEETQGEQKESASDFYINKKPENAPNQFQVWGADAFGMSIMEHIWVESLSPSDRFCSVGGTTKDHTIQLVDVKAETWAIVNDYRDKGGFRKDNMGIIYLLQGVCHQMSNRCIFPTVGEAVRAKNTKHPVEYAATCLCYGIAGLNYGIWYLVIYLPTKYKYVKGEEVQAQLPEGCKGLDYFDLESAADELLRSTEEFLRKEGVIGEGGNPIAEEQKAWLLWLEKTMKKFGFLEDDGKIRIPEDLTEKTVREIVRTLNEDRPDLLAALKEKIGADKYREFFGTENTKCAIADEEMAIHYYLNKP